MTLGNPLFAYTIIARKKYFSHIVVFSFTEMFFFCISISLVILILAVTFI